MKTVLLVDLSNVFWTSWYAGVNKAARWPFDETMGRVRTEAKKYHHCAIMTDGERSFRNDLDARWKKNRDEKHAGGVAMLAEVERALDTEGFHVFKVADLEADDLIATGVGQLKAWDEQAIAGSEPHDGLLITINSSDRDLLGLLEPGVQILAVNKPRLIQAENVRENKKFGIDPPKVRDFLVLSDDHNGVKYFEGIGPVHAARLLNEYGDLDGILRAVDTITPPSIQASIRKAMAGLVDDRPLIDVAVQIVTLRKDAPIDAMTIFQQKEPTPTGVTWDDDKDAPSDAGRQSRGEGGATGSAGAPADAGPLHGTGEVVGEPMGRDEATSKGPSVGEAQQAKVTASAQQTPATMIIAPRWELALEPITPRDAFRLAETAFRAGFWPKHGSVEGHMMIILAGRSRGLTAFDALNGMHIIEGKPVFGAYLLIGMVQGDKQRCAYFELAESDESHAVWITKRKGGKVEQRRAYTIEQAEKAGLLRPTSKGAPSNWTKHPEDFLIKASGAKLTRAVYADITSGAVAAEELGYE